MKFPFPLTPVWVADRGGDMITTLPLVFGLGLNEDRPDRSKDDLGGTRLDKSDDPEGSKSEIMF
uniref:Uncharacterized protein n=1 Tax=Pithovirus LCPAC201 TaxID=2506591 RepID=A0A481Z6I4_9VIRU|nr:MAG: hypothetical protein LCPAC201_00400 [Pithovirus LCPAC201]